MVYKNPQYLLPSLLEKKVANPCFRRISLRSVEDYWRVLCKTRGKKTSQVPPAGIPGRDAGVRTRVVQGLSRREVADETLQIRLHANLW